jgi:hypothetical protein
MSVPRRTNLKLLLMPLLLMLIEAQAIKNPRPFRIAVSQQRQDNFGREKKTAIKPSNHPRQQGTEV